MNIISVLPMPDSLPAFLLTELMMSCVHRHWKSFTSESKRDARESAMKVDKTKKHLDWKCQQVAVTKWVNWVKLHKKTNAGRWTYKYFWVGKCCELTVLQTATHVYCQRKLALWLRNVSKIISFPCIYTHSCDSFCPLYFHHYTLRLCSNLKS